jgi:hypothetical protein
MRCWCGFARRDAKPQSFLCSAFRQSTKIFAILRLREHILLVRAVFQIFKFLESIGTGSQ